MPTQAPLALLKHVMFINEANGITQLPSADVHRLQQVREFLRQEYLSPDLRLSMICRKFGLNEFKLKKGFKQLFGCTVFGYVQELKMRTARQMLVAGKMNVNGIAEHLGYSSPNHFSAAFRKMYGHPPSRLRTFTFSFFQ